MLVYENSHERYMQRRRHQGGDQRAHEEKPQMMEEDTIPQAPHNHLAHLFLKIICM